MTTGTVALRGALRSELSQLVRSPLTRTFCLLAPVLGFAGAWLAISAGLAGELADDEGAVAVSTGFAVIPYLAAVSGLARAAGEVSGGAARSIFSWVPSRWPVIAAKGLLQAVTGVTLAVGATLGGLAALGVAWARMPPLSVAAVAVVAGGTAASALLAVLGVGIGCLTVHRSHGYLVLAGLLVALPVAAGALSISMPGLAGFGRHLPMSAANALFDPVQGAVPVATGSAAATLAGWAAVALGAGFVAVQRRDVA